MNKISLLLFLTSFLCFSQDVSAGIKTPVELCRAVTLDQIEIQRCAEKLSNYYDARYIDGGEGAFISKQLMIAQYMEMLESLFNYSYVPSCQAVEAKVEIVQNDCVEEEVFFSWDMVVPELIDMKYLNMKDGTISEATTSTNRLNIMFETCADDKLYAYNLKCRNGKSAVDVIIIIDADIATGGGNGQSGGIVNGRPIGHPKPNLPYQGIIPGNQTSLSFSLAPNPISDTPTLLQITTSKTQTSAIQIELYNALGKRIYNTTQEALPNNTLTQYLPTADLPVGLYFVTLSTGEEQITQRLVKRE